MYTVGTFIASHRHFHRVSRQDLLRVRPGFLSPTGSILPVSACHLGGSSARNSAENGGWWGVEGVCGVDWKSLGLDGEWRFHRSLRSDSAPGCVCLPYARFLTRSCFQRDQSARMTLAEGKGRVSEMAKKDAAHEVHG